MLNAYGAYVVWATVGCMLTNAAGHHGQGGEVVEDVGALMGVVDRSVRSMTARVRARSASSGLCHFGSAVCHCRVLYLVGSVNLEV